MRLSRVLIAGAAVAAAGIATTAFTNSNTFDANGAVDNEVGYGELAVSGVTVSNVAYTPLTTDATTLDSVTFTVAASAADNNSLLTLTGASGTLGGGPITCTAAGTTAPYTIFCDVTGVLIADITKVALTVVSK